MGRVHKRIGLRVAKMPQVAAKIEEVARDIEQRAKGLAMEHRLTGRYQQSIKRRRSGFRGVKDQVVYSDDPQAVVIEYGAAPHMIGKRRHPGMRGMYILTRAAAKYMGGGP